MNETNEKIGENDLKQSKVQRIKSLIANEIVLLPYDGNLEDGYFFYFPHNSQIRPVGNAIRNIKKQFCRGLIGKHYLNPWPEILNVFEDGGSELLIMPWIGKKIDKIHREATVNLENYKDYPFITGAAKLADKMETNYDNDNFKIQVHAIEDPMYNSMTYNEKNCKTYFFVLPSSYSYSINKYKLDF